MRTRAFGDTENDLAGGNKEGADREVE